MSPPRGRSSLRSASRPATPSRDSWARRWWRGSRTAGACSTGHETFCKFVLLAGLFSTTLSATIGVTSLALGGYARWTDYRAIWFTWWMGDAASVLVFAPVLR